jgi:hypothetical protein
MATPEPRMHPHEIAAPTLFLAIGSTRAQRVFAAIFLLMLMLPMATQLAGWDNQVALLERHEPAAFPHRPQTREALQAWPQAFDRWLLDGTGLRSAMVFAGSFIEVNLLGQSTSPDVLLGRDGWLFHTGDRTFEQLRGIDVFTPTQLDRWIDRMQQRRDWLAARGIAFLIVIVPNKERVYSEFLPTSVVPARTSRPGQIAGRLKERRSDLPLLDLTDTLVAAKRETRVYAKRDTHWTGSGAFRGYLAIMQRLQPMLPSLRPLLAEQMEDIAITYPARDLDLMRMLGLGWAGHGETVDVPLLRDDPPWQTRNESLHVDGEYRMLLTSTRPDAPASLWLRDSFSDALAVYLNHTFRRATLVSHQGLRFDKALIEAEQPDVVVYEVVERFIRSELPPD